MKKQGIYCIEHIESGKKYIGSSSDISKRFKIHKNTLLNLTHHCIYLQRSVNKYGLDKFNFYILEETFGKNTKELFELETKYLMDAKNSGEILFNIGSVGGGDNFSNHPHKEDIIKKISQTMKEKYEKMTDEEKLLRSNKQLGELNGNWKNGGVSWKMCPKCNVKKIAYASNVCGDCRDRTKKNNPFYGKKHSEETLEKLRNRIPPNLGKPPDAFSFTNQYEIQYPDGSNKRVHGLKAIATEFNTSIANVGMTIDRMAKGSMPIKRSMFYQHMIKVIKD